ncbi:MAG TPA: radical SAM protein [Burkholderiales bacterium]|nr:radical SAM protein [Burkholderiales bacterium]
MKKRVLVVNVFLDEYRRTRGSPMRVPRGSGHIYLAGAFNPHTVDVRVYSEQVNGYLHDAALLGWPDMLVLTGLTNGLDRMLHLTAYARTLNPRVVVVAGGPCIRALPNTCRQYFDRICLGDIEELRQVAEETFGAGAAVEGEMFPRYDLAEPSQLLGYVESSRNCNFRCSFCSLTGEKAKYGSYHVDYVRRQIEATGKKVIVFLDNNFYGSGREHFDERIDMLADLRRKGTIKGWSAILTSDFFARPQNLERAKQAGCLSLFCGVESFDAATLRSYNKKQNMITPQIDMIRSCLEAGIMFHYGVMLDPTTRRIHDLEAEIDFILGRPEIPMPAFFTLPIPLLGTPYFRQSVERGSLLPNLRLRELNGVNITQKTLDPTDRAVAFARDLVNLRGRHGRAARHAAGFVRRYARRLSPLQLGAAVGSVALTCLPSVASSPLNFSKRRQAQTFYAPTESLDDFYRPVMPVRAELQHYFRPTMITDAQGGIAEDIAADYAQQELAVATA